MVRRGASLDANQAGRQLLKERNYLAPLQLTTDDYLAPSANAWTWKTDLAISKPIVVIVCMARSSES
jgi:hypothetical protein